MSIEIVKPSIINEVEFYISSDGNKSGVSQVGLARLCGVTEAGIRNIVNTDRSKTRPKALESFTDNVFHLELGSEKQAKIITTSAATEIIFYYAFESKTANAIAKFSAKQFAKQGMHNWIKEITGFSVTDNNQMLTKTLNQLHNNINILTQEMKEWRTVRRVADDNMEGVNILIEEINKSEEHKQLDANSRTYTVMEWLEEQKGIPSMRHGQKTKLGRAVAETYKSLKQYKPKQERRMYRSRRTNSIIPKVVAAYTQDDFPILEIAYNEFMTR